MAVYTRDGSTTDLTPKASKDMSEITLSTNEILKELRKNAKSGSLSSVMESNRNEDKGKSPEAQSDREWKQRERQRRKAQWDSAMKKVEQGYDRHFKDLNAAFTNPLAGVAKGMDGMVKGLFTKTGALMNTKLGDLLPKKRPTADEPATKRAADLRKRRGERDKRYQTRLKQTATLRNQRKQEQDARTRAKAILKTPKKGEKVTGQLQSLIGANKKADKDRQEQIKYARLSNVTVGQIMLTVAAVGLAFPFITKGVTDIMILMKTGWKHFWDVKVPALMNPDVGLAKQFSLGLESTLSKVKILGQPILNNNISKTTKENINEKLESYRKDAGVNSLEDFDKLVKNINWKDEGTFDALTNEFGGYAYDLSDSDQDVRQAAIMAIGPERLVEFLNNKNVKYKNTEVQYDNGYRVNMKQLRADALENYKNDAALQNLTRYVQDQIENDMTAEQQLALLPQKRKEMEKQLYESHLDDYTKMEAWMIGKKVDGKEYADETLNTAKSKGIEFKPETGLEALNRRSNDVVNAFANTIKTLGFNMFNSTNKDPVQVNISLAPYSGSTVERR